MLYHSPAGFILIGIENGYISQLHFTDDENAFKDKNLIKDKTDKRLLKECIKQLDEYFSGKRKIFELPVKQQGSIFQEKVWKELLQIPFGKTISYHQLAQRLGDIKSIRAAAAANGKNNLAIVVPCHRVIGTNGSLTGYAGGLPRKKWLLDHENKYANGVTMLF